MRNPWLQLVTILALSAAGAVATWKIAAPPVAGPLACDPAALEPIEICLDTVRNEWPEGSFLWIDARTEAEWRHDGLPGSLHLTTTAGANFEEQVEKNFEKIATATRAVVYCGDVGCGLSKEVAKRLPAYGPKEVRALHGGTAALRAAGMLKDSSSAP